MRQNEQEESVLEQDTQFHPNISESSQIEKPYQPPKRRRKATIDRSTLEFEPLDLPPKRPYRRRADRSTFEFEVLHLPPKRPYRRRPVTDLDAPEDNNEV